MATHSSILAWRIPWTESLAGYSRRGHKESDRTEQLSAAHPFTFSPCARHCSELLRCINSFNPHNDLLRQIQLYLLL